MRRLKSSLTIVALALAPAIILLAQTAAEKPSNDILRVAAHLQCQCGCKDSVATCSMLECGFSKPAKERIAKMQAVGMSDQQIINAFVRDYGPGVYLAPPSPFGWIVPYVSVGFGLVVIWLFIKRYHKRPAPAAAATMEIDDPDLAKYRDQIEKDLANLE